MISQGVSLSQVVSPEVGAWGPLHSCDVTTVTLATSGWNGWLGSPSGVHSP